MNFREFQDKYLEIARSKSINNDLLNAFMFLVLVGAVCHKKKIRVNRYGTKDLRIHPMLIQPSRTGKGEAMKVLAKMAKFCGLRMTDETQFTDAGLGGEINTQVAARNRQKGYTRGDPEYQEPVTVGDLGLYDIISFSEGKQMIKLSAYSEDKLEILQMAMDTPGWYRKKLASEIAVEYEVNASIIGTTYFLDGFEEIFLEQGIFQRMLVNVREFGMGDRFGLNKELCLGEPKIDEQDLDDILRAFASDVLAQTSKTPDGTTLRFNEKAKKALWRKTQKWMERIQSDFVGKEQEVMSSYTTSSINMYAKIAGIAAVMNGRSEITVAEVNDAHQFISAYMNSIMNEILMALDSYGSVDIGAFIAKLVIESKTIDKATGVAISGLTRDEIVSKVQEKHIHVSKNKVHKLIKDGLENRFYKEEVDNRVKRIVRNES